MIFKIAADPVITKAGMPAEEVPEKQLHKYMCSAAVTPNGQIYSNVCETCQASCAYGRRLVQLRKEREA